MKIKSPVIIVSALVVGATGLILLQSSRAANNFVAFEAESTADAEYVAADANASGGSHVLFKQEQINTTPLVIFDTDMGPDIDDAVALAQLHGYQQRGLLELAAVTISRDSVNAARYTDAVNTHYGRPNIPIGIYRGGTVTPDQANNDRYTVLASNYSHDVHQSTIPDGYSLQRQIMAQAAQQNRRVIFIQTGFSGNLSQLVNSGGDGNSSLSGIQLIQDTVDSLSIMAGRFNSGNVEFNIAKDLSSARNLFSKWPVRMVVSDWNIGVGTFYPYFAGIRDNLPSNHPVRRAYEFQTLSWHRDLDSNPPSVFYNMASWDLTSVLDAIDYDTNYFNRTGPGRVSLNAQGVSTYSSGGAQHYILNQPPNKQSVINRMIEMVE